MKKRKPIGDPFRKYRQPKVNPAQLKSLLEELMDIDHIMGRPFLASLVVNPETGLPDDWFFEKAKTLGHEFDDNKAFWEKHRAELHSRKDDFNDFDDDEVIWKRFLERMVQKSEGDQNVVEETLIKEYGSINKAKKDIVNRTKSTYIEASRRFTGALT